MKKLLFYFAFISSLPAFSQQSLTVTGIVQDTTGTPLTGATVKLTSVSDTLSTSIDPNGGFRFSKVKAPTFKITAELLGFESFTKTYTVNNLNAKIYKIDPIKLRVRVNQLSEITIVGLVNPMKIKEDTVEYKASAYAVRAGAPVEDVVKKLPGVTVDKDGNITAQGKAITRVRVNGKDFFGGDVQTATQNLPADVIDNIQIIDDYGDQANLTGNKTGDPEKILNINVQKNKNKGSFGNGALAGGNEGRYMGRIMASNFKDERQLSLIGAINNTNVNAFNFNGGGRGGGARGANFGGGNNGGGNGITNSQSIGLNYRNNWGKKITSYGSYSFSGRKNNTVGTSYQQDLNPMNIRTTNGSSNNNTNSINHRLTWNVEYKIDTANFIKFTPYFSYGNSRSNGKGISEISRSNYYTFNNTHSENTSYSPSGGSELLYNRKFEKRGRNFSISSGVDYSSSNQNRDVFNTYHDIDSTSLIPIVKDSILNQAIGNDNQNTRTNIRTAYNEPISKTSFLELSYAWNKSSSRSIRDVNDIDQASKQPEFNSNQSNNYKYEFITNRIGLNFRSVKLKYNYTLGIAAQPSTLTGLDLGRNIGTSNPNFNLIPTARFVYNFAKSHSLNLNYGGSSREPSFNQLQPVRDSSNRNNIIVGNPNLNAEFTNRFSIQYNKFDVVSGNSLFTNLSFDQTQNKIVSNRVDNTTGTGRTTSYLNTNGFYGINGNVSYSKPFAERKYTITLSANANYDNNISFRDNQKNQGQNWFIRPATRFRMDLKDIIDVDLNASYAINKTITYTNTDLAKTLTLGLNGKNFFFKDYTLGYDFSKIINSGYIGTVNSNPVLLNVYFEHRFLKNDMGTLRLQGFDLFNQNTGISREIDGTITTYSQNNRLGRYFLLSFNLRLQKFAGKRPEYQREGGGDRIRNGGGGGGYNGNN